MSLRRFQYLLMAVSLSAAAAARADEVVYARDLALSPDGRTLAFAWAGDLWTVGVEGGVAVRLTANDATESDPVWSPDGARIAFASNRHGAGTLFLMNRDGSDVRRVSYADTSETPLDFTPDGRYIVFSASRDGQLEREPKIYRIPAGGGQAFRVMNCLASSLRYSPDGRLAAFNRGSTPWWRRNYRGSANYDLWVRDLASGAFTKLTSFEGNDRAPQWDGDSKSLYFLSDRGGTVNIWRQSISAGDAQQVTFMKDDDVRDLTVSRDGRMLAFTHWDKLYVMPLPSGSPREIRVTAPADSSLADDETRTFTRDASESAPSPDGKELAIVVRGEIFVIKAEPDKSTRRVTRSAARSRMVCWSPDGKALFFISDEAGQEDLFRATSAEQPARALSDSLRFRIERVTDTSEPEWDPSVSPDGKSIAFTRVRGDLFVRDLASGRETRLLENWSGTTYRWSPDSKWIAYEAEDEEFNPDIWIIPADGGKPAVNISRHPDADRNPQWSADGNILAFSSRRAVQDTDLYLTFLAPQLAEMSSVDRDEYFKQQAEAVKKKKPLKSCAASGTIALAAAGATQPSSAPASGPANAAASKPSSRPTALRARLRGVLKDLLKEDEPAARAKPVAAKDAEKDGEEKEKDEDKEEKRKFKLEWELDSAWKRVRPITTLPGDQGSFALAPDGASAAFVSGHEGSPALFFVKWNGEDRKKALSQAVGGLEWLANGTRLFYLTGGAPGSCGAGGGDSKSHAFSAKMIIDNRALARQKFNDAACALGLRFYHPTMKGLDWPRLTDKYREFALRVRTTGEFNEIFNMLQGELNASHLGISGGGGRGPAGESGERCGHLGCDFDASFVGPGLRVSAIVPRSPADRDESRLYVGDVLLTVNGHKVGPDASIEAALRDTIGEQVIIEFVPSPDLAKASASAPASQDAPRANELQPAGAPGASRELIIRPISMGELNGLRYDAWVEGNRRLVHDLSDGRVGYSHIRGMSEPSFNEFERDLYAAASGRDGLIIDVRCNGGGWTADWVMAVLSVQRHATTVARGGKPGYPQDRLIFYAWTKAATMMCDQYSFSNAEIVSHAFKNLRRGPLVGVPTHGGVISTGSYGLVDGGAIRMPFRGWYLPDGRDMELNGAVPDVIVPVTPEDEEQGRNPQIEAAVKATMEEIQRRAGQDR